MMVVLGAIDPAGGLRRRFFLFFFPPPSLPAAARAAIRPASCGSRAVAARHADSAASS